MTDPGDIAGFNFERESADLAERAKRLTSMLHGRIAEIELSGPNEGEQDRLYNVANNLERVSTVAARAIEAIDATNFEVPEPEPEINIGGEEVFNLVCSFLDHLDGRAFTTSDLKDYLRRKVDIPRDKKDFDGLFNTWRQEIVELASQKGQRAMWATPVQLKRKEAYALGVTGGLKLYQPPKVAKQPQVKKVQVPSPTAQTIAEEVWGREQPAVPVPEAPPEDPKLTAAFDFVKSRLGVKANQLIEQLAGQLGVSMERAAELSEQLVANQRLFRVRTKGTAYFSVDAPERTILQPAEKKSDAEYILSPKQRKQAELILEALTNLEQGIVMLSSRQIINKLDTLGLDKQGLKANDINPIARKLAAQNIMYTAQIKRGTKTKKTGHSKRPPVFKVGLASNAVKSLWKTPEGKQQIRELIESGQSLEVDE